MNYKAWIFLILGCIFVILYTYNYYTTDNLKLEDIKPNQCISNTSNYGIYNLDNFSIIVNKSWKLGKLENVNNDLTLIFNENNPSEFISIWIGDYNKSSKSLLIDTLKKITNYEIIHDKKITINNREYDNFKIKFKYNNLEYTQNLYGFIENNKGYLIITKYITNNEKYYINDINTLICSFFIKK